jgi:hypothetical protein
MFGSAEGRLGVNVLALGGSSNPENSAKGPEAEEKINS